MAEIDDGLLTGSDAELDSDVEDVDMDFENRNSVVKLHNQHGINGENSKFTRTPTMALNSKITVEENGVSAVDFDSILSELNDLELQLNRQSIISDTTSVIPDPTAIDPPFLKESSSSIGSTSIFRDYTNLKTNPSPHHRKASSSRNAVVARNAIERTVATELGNELDVALSELSALVGTSFFCGENGNDDVASDGRRCCCRSKEMHRNGCSGAGSRRSSSQSDPNDASSSTNHHHRRNEVAVGSPSLSRICNNNVQDGISPATEPNNFACPPCRSFPSSSSVFSRNGWQERSSDGGQNDSAFDDNVSIPSSGSHVSMTTSSRSSGSSVTNGTALGPTNETEEILKCRDSSKAVVDKNNESNLNKILVRVYSPEGSSDSILVTERMTVSEVIDGLLTKNRLQSNFSWSIIEQLPNLLMERLLEDDECLAENMLTWTRDSENKLLLMERPDMYDIFLCPEKYLTTEDKTKQCSDNVRRVIIQEFLDSNCRLPDIDGMLFIKSEGKKSWKKLYFILRASGIYYNPKGRSKTLIDLVCLQKLDLVEVYTGIGWKKKYRAPTDFGFALKHPQIQKKSPKYIKYLCAEDGPTMCHWINSIRLAKCGQKLHGNFEQRRIGMSRNATASQTNQTALIHEKISEIFSQRSETRSNGAGTTQRSPTPLQTFRSESPPERSSPSRFLRSCSDANESTRSGALPAKMTPSIPITTQVTKQLSGQQQTLARSPRRMIPPKSPKRGGQDTCDALLPPPPLVMKDGDEDWNGGGVGFGMPHPPPNHEMLVASVDQKTVRMPYPSANAAGKWGTSPKHAVIKRSTSVGHRDVDEPSPIHTLPPVASPVPPRLSSSPTTTTGAAVPSAIVPSTVVNRSMMLRKLPSSDSSSDYDENNKASHPSPKPKPPIPPKRKDVLRPSASVESSPTKGSFGTPPTSQKHDAESPPTLSCRQGRSSSVVSTLPFGNSPTANFLNDLQRVVSQKQTCGVGGMTDVVASSAAARSSVDLDSLPPPPAALLEGLKNLNKTGRPPPPPKRSQETHLTSK